MTLRSRILRSVFLGLLATELLTGHRADAQSTPPKDGRPAYGVDLHAVPFLSNGKLAVIQGAVDGSGLRFLVENLDILQPVAVTLLSVRPEDALTLRLAKDSWDERAREGTTEGTAQQTFKIRTQGDMRIVVNSVAGVKPFQLIVWAGNEVKVPTPSIFVAAGNTSAGTVRPPGAAAEGSSFDGPSRREAPVVLWVIAGLIGIAVLLLAVIVFRRFGMKGGAAVVLIAATLGTAQRVIGQDNVYVSDWIKSLPNYNKEPPPNIPPPPTPKPPALPPPVPSPDAITAQEWKSYNDGIQKGAKWANLGVDLSESFVNWAETYKQLSPDDAAYDPNYSPPGSPQIPLQCSTSPGCAQCFGGAQAELNQVRYRFEKLRRVSEKTKAFYTASLSFGDSVSGIHGVAGLGWQAERIKIMQTMKTFDAAHDAKYAELLMALQAALTKIAACEQAHFNTADWYNRFGFIYYTFMADRYRR